jgi:predicted RND superfamily exporter protein
MKTNGFWQLIARVILRNRLLILLVIAGITAALATQWKYMRFSNTEANLLPIDHPISLTYQNFLSQFGEEGNIVAVAITHADQISAESLGHWHEFSRSLEKLDEVDLVLSTENVRTLKKSDSGDRFTFSPYYEDVEQTPDPESLKHFFISQPFYEQILYNKETSTVRTLIYLDKKIVNTSARKTFILEKFNPLVEKFEQNSGLNAYVSGMPYIRTMNAQSIIDEIGLFILGALVVTTLIFFLFFKSYRATLISMAVVIIGVMWSFGILGLLRYEITVLTALIPPLIIVIGIPNCIFLINKYQQEVKNHGNKALSLIRVIGKVGNATLMTNMTTASGFATFALTNSNLLKEFGIVASINILGIFLLSIAIIPIIYSMMDKPKDRHLKHLEKRWIGGFVQWTIEVVRHRRVTIYMIAISALAISIIGIFQIKTSGSPIEDMPKNKSFYQDIGFFEQEFTAVLPLDIVVETKQKNGVYRPATLKRIDELQQYIETEENLAKPLSVVNLVKYAKQAYYNGLPQYYELPSPQERSFINQAILNSSESQNNLLSAFTDSSGQITRISTGIKNLGTKEMELVYSGLDKTLDRLFPKEQYTTYTTGKALLFLKGTEYLITNLMISLVLAILLISLFMAYLFRSFRMIVISLIPNILPLIITAGIMGFVGIPIKPSTILVFSIAFGISVDDTIHFLAKYRQELVLHQWKIKVSVYGALKETGVSMFYTSIVLFFGFSIFTVSDFGGTIALGALVSITLLLAMLSNLVLLPALLLSLERSIANKNTLKEIPLDILPDDSDQ